METIYFYSTFFGPAFRAGNLKNLLRFFKKIHLFHAPLLSLHVEDTFHRLLQAAILMIVEERVSRSRILD